MSELLQIGDIVEYSDNEHSSVGIVVRPYLDSLGRREPFIPYEIAWFSMPWENKHFCAPHITLLKKLGHIDV